MKKCSKCLIPQELDAFYQASGKNRGRRAACRTCCNLESKQYRATHKIELSVYFRKRETTHKLQIRRKQALYRHKNREQLRAYHRQWSQSRKSDPFWVINRRMGLGIWRSLRDGKAGRRWETLAGYTAAVLKRHIERRFTTGMTWALFLEGEIHIDHRVPITVFQFTSAEDPQFKACWALENLRPMWKVENIKKSNKLTQPFQQYLL
jgi:hypothetical protein